MEKLVQAAKAFQMVSREVVLRIVFTAIIGHVFLVFGLFFLAKAYDLGLGVLAIAWIRSLTMIVLLLPVTVANIGVREGSFIWSIWTCDGG